MTQMHFYARKEGFVVKKMWGYFKFLRALETGERLAEKDMLPFRPRIYFNSNEQ